jgi:hypothetical protein
VFPRTNGYTLSEELGLGTATIVRASIYFEEDATDTQTVWERESFNTSPAISKSLDAALQVSGLRKEDIDLFDFYSFVSLDILNSIQNSQLTLSKPAASLSSPNSPATTCPSRQQPPSPSSAA